MNVNTFNKCRDLISMNSQQNERLKHKWSINTWKLYNLLENKQDLLVQVIHENGFQMDYRINL